MKFNFEIRRVIALLLVNIIIASALVTPAYAIYSYYSEAALTGEDKRLKEWTWSSDGEKAALTIPLIPTGLSQQQTALMGGYTTKFWFQNVKAKTASIEYKGQSVSVDLSKFHHRYYACADSHSTGWFTPAGSQIVLKQMYLPTDNIDDYPMFIRKAPADMETRKFILLMISMLSAAYETPSETDLKDSDHTSMYYYLLWLSIWANDVYAQHGVFHGVTPEDDWDYVRDQLRVGLKDRLDPDSWGSYAIYDAFREGGPAQAYFYNCWKAAKFLSSFDYRVDLGTSLSVGAPEIGTDGMYHASFDYSGLHEYEKEVYRRLRADDLQSGWEYSNDGSRIDFRSPGGEIEGGTLAVLHLEENSEEDHFYNCGFGIGGLAGFQGCAKGGSNSGMQWGNTQVYFSAVSQPLEITVSGKPASDTGYSKVMRYQHNETWQAHYNVRLRKYDSETGRPLAGSKWDILEAFDSDQLNNTNLETEDNWANRGGSQFIKWDGWDYGDGNAKGDVSNDPCTWDINVTNEQGVLMLGDNEENASLQTAHNDAKTYTYTKGYCGGHPEPEIEESGDPQIDAENEAAAWEAWQEEVDRCEALTAGGGFYHSIHPGVAKAQLEADRDELYQQFVSLKYKYSAVEIAPKPGYAIHGSHTDDIPVEVKTVTSSEYKHRFGGSLINPSYGGTEEGAIVPNTKATPSIAAATPSIAKAYPSVAVSKPLAVQAAPAAVLHALSAASRSPLLPPATPSNPRPPAATQSNSIGVNSHSSSGLQDSYETPENLVLRSRKRNQKPVKVFDKRSISFEASQIPPISQGNSTTIDHTFLVYDHRTEGEVHMNKRDLYLEKGERNAYDSYGDSMGDGTLEGAVYGLFALKDIRHPDGHSGIIYQKDNLVSIAATDRNGDASFLAFTEAPGMIWNYETGEAERTAGGFWAPKNLHRTRVQADQIPDMENYEGCDAAGRPVRLVDSFGGDGTGYRKCSSNQAGIGGITGSHATYPIADNETDNGNCWIGRPLIVEADGTSYYVKELTRSEGYELSVNGRTNLLTNGETNYEGEYPTPDVTLKEMPLDADHNGNYFEVTGRNVAHDVTLQGVDFPKGAAFGLSAMKKIPEKIVVPIYSTVTKPAMATEGAFVYRNGQKVAASLGDVVSFPGGQSYCVHAVSQQRDETVGVKPMNYHSLGIPAAADLNSGGNPEEFQRLYNQALDEAGYREPSDEAPWLRIRLDGLTDAEWMAAVAQGMKRNDLQYFNSLRITDMEEMGGSLYGIFRYEWRLYGDGRDTGVYVPSKDRIYVKKDSGNGYFVYVAYDKPDSNAYGQ